MDMRYLKDMPIAILGAGAVGKTMAADCAMGGKEVRLWDQPRFAKTNFTNIEKTGITLSGNQFSYFGFQRKGNVKIALATDDMAKAVKGAGIIIVATVAIAHEDVFRQLIPLLGEERLPRHNHRQRNDGADHIVDRGGQGEQGGIDQPGQPQQVDGQHRGFFVDLHRGPPNEYSICYSTSKDRGVSRSGTVFTKGGGR